MKIVILLIISLFLFLFGCDAPSDAIASETATLTIFHTNDVMGYLTPCG